jgi:hypothetical protein
MGPIPLLLSVALTRAHVSAQANPTEVPFEIGQNAIIVPATINGRQLRLIFDTGFGGDAAVDSSIDLGKPAGFMNLQDFVGVISVPYYEPDHVKLGERTITGKDFKVVSQPGIGGQSIETHVDGLMGFSIIKDNVTEINFEHSKFIFHPDTDDISKRTPDNKKTFLLQLLPVGVRSMMLNVVAPGGKNMVMALDTGNAFYATTYKDVLERLGLWKSDQDPKFVYQAGVASGPVDSWEKTMTGMTIFGVPVPQSTWDIIDIPAGSITMDGTVGFGFLRHFNITIDYKRRYVWLENFDGKVSEPPEGTVGISAFWFPEQKNVVITRVSPDSPAAKVGMKQGDVLLDVEDTDLTNMSYKRLRSLLAGEVGSKLRLTFSHEGIATRVTLERAALVNP